MSSPKKLAMLLAAALAVAALLLLSLSFSPRPASAQQSRVVYTVGTGANALEAMACGTSPCTIGAASTTVMNTNANRSQCLLQNVGLTTFSCLHGAGTASTTNMHFVLKPASVANAGDGGTYSCTQGPVIWRGPVQCISSAGGGSLNASAASAAGF
jgi:hypothetical protein